MRLNEKDLKEGTGDEVAYDRIEKVKKLIRFYAIMLIVTGMGLVLGKCRTILFNSQYSSNFTKIGQALFIIFGLLYLISGIGILKFKEGFRILLMWNMVFAIMYAIYENIFIFHGYVSGAILMHIPILIFYVMLFYFFNKPLVKQQFK